MHILRIFPNFQETMLYSEHYVAKELNKNGVKTTMLSTKFAPRALEPFIKEKSEIDTSSWYDLIRVESGRIKDKPYFKSWKEIKEIISDDKYDVLHLYGYGTFTTLQVLYMVKFLGIKKNLILSDHSDSHTSSFQGFALKAHDLFFRLMMRPVRNLIKEYTTPILECQQTVENRFNLFGRKWNLIPLGFDEDIFYHQEKVRNQREKMVIGFAGKVSAGKRVDFLIKAIQKLDIRSKVELVITGVNPQNAEYHQELETLSKQVDFPIEFRPLASPSLLRKFYNYIDLAVYPGGVSITTIEASACGVPLIMYRSTANLEYRVEGGRGALFTNEEELLNLLSKYQKEYEEIGFDHSKIAEVTKSISSWKSISKKYLKIYKRQS